MVGRKKTQTDKARQFNSPIPERQDLNEIVAYNFRLARELRAGPQEEAAQALEPPPWPTPSPGQHLGHRKGLRGRAAPRVRRPRGPGLRAPPLDLPLVWFFLPPPADHRALHRTGDTVSELYGIVFGREDQLEPVYDRLREIGIDEPSEVDRTIEKSAGTQPGSPN